MAVHLQDEFMVYYNADESEENVESAQNNIVRPTSTLEAFFKLCSENNDNPSAHENTRHLLYPNVGMLYTWNKKVFKRRVNSQYAIGRVYTVHPREA